MRCVVVSDPQVLLMFCKTTRTATQKVPKAFLEWLSAKVYSTNFRSISGGDCVILRPAVVSVTQSKGIQSFAFSCRSFSALLFTIFFEFGYSRADCVVCLSSGITNITSHFMVACFHTAVVNIGVVCCITLQYHIHTKDTLDTSWQTEQSCRHTNSRVPNVSRQKNIDLIVEEYQKNNRGAPTENS